MRKHEMAIENSHFDVFAESLRKRGVDEQLIAAAIEDAKLTSA